MEAVDPQAWARLVAVLKAAQLDHLAYTLMHEVRCETSVQQGRLILGLGLRVQDVLLQLHSHARGVLLLLGVVEIRSAEPETRDTHSSI